MPGKYAQPITIEKAIGCMDSRTYLLPALQRNFVWDTGQICALFDSLMCGYPINTFMFWEVSDKKNRDDVRFYEFLKVYRERFAETNKLHRPTGEAPFYAVIDGQQRLTALYLGLKGTYAYKLRYKHWPNEYDEAVLPPRTLYLNLAASCPAETDEENDERMRYDFRFLTKEKFNELSKKPGAFWFRVGRILDCVQGDIAGVIGFAEKILDEEGQADNTYARDTLVNLRDALMRDEKITYYEETDQNIDGVLDIFLRTNGGGTQLTFSDMLFSIAASHWKDDVREQIDGLVKSVRAEGFPIDRNLVLKAALVLTGSSVRFRIDSFTKDTVKKIEGDWEKIKTCIQQSFILTKFFGLNDHSLHSKNAVIPIAYYLFRKGLYDQVNNPAWNEKERKQISKWLHMSLLKRVFGAHGDALLNNLRNIIDNHLDKTLFPLDQVIESYRGKSKSLIFDEEDIDGLLKTQHGDPYCFSILALVFPDLDYTQSREIDHLHPASAFRNLDKDWPSDDLECRPFYKNQENWNSIVNLYPLLQSQNRSKKDKTLVEWLKKKDTNLSSNNELLIPKEGLGFKDFPEFIKARTKLLKQKLKQTVGA